jgi:hypothetical protein
MKTPQKPAETTCDEVERLAPTTTVVLTEEQRRSVLYALEDKLLETERYVSSSKVPDKPGPEQSCCDIHLARYERDKEIYDAMRARKKAVKATIALFSKDGN